MSHFFHRYYDNDGDLPDDIAQQALQPGVKDPKLWLVKCRIGEERSTVLSLMRKFIAFSNTESPLRIKSAVAPEKVKGAIYIEAHKASDVKTAIDGVGSLRMGQYRQEMINMNEMTDVLKVTKEQASIRPKQWVRLKRGIYKDDLAQVDYVDQANGQAHLKLIPRIDYTRMRGALKDQTSENQKRKKGKRPVAKLFNPEAIREIGGDITGDGDFQVFEGNRYRSGFLYKNFTLSAILVDGVKPSLTELERFEETDGGDIADTHVGDSKGHCFAPGDNVEVTEGELVHLTGKILAVEGDKIVMMPKHDDLKDPLDFQAHELKKFFLVGDHVKVISGQFEGDTGLIVRVDEKQCVMFSDLTMHEVKLFPKDLQLCSDMATGVDSMGQFQLGDMVQLDQQTVGVIIRLEKEYFQILNMHGKVVQVKHQGVTKKRDTKRAVALDSEQNQITVRDHVKVVEGPHTGREGEIKHLYRNFAFVHSRLLLENGGVFVCRTRHLALAGGTRPLTAALASPNVGYMSPKLMSPKHPSSDGGLGGHRQPLGGVNRGGRAREDIDLIGKTIKITQGTYKGYIGIVKDAVGTTARVELHATCQTISVDKSRIQQVGGQTGTSSGGRTGSYAGATPSMGSRTPMSGSKTPMYGSQTPMYEGGRTPRHGSETPRDDGGRTPMHGGSSVWDPSSGQTPRPDFDDYGGDPSPAGYNNPPTPGYANPDTPSGGPYTPQTPGMYSSGDGYSNYNNPSPVGYSGAAPSPGGQYMSPSPVEYSQGGVTPSPTGYAYSPMTPGGTGSSPMGLNPQTPGGGGEHGTMMSEWQTTEIEVRIKRTHEDSDLIGQTGIIRGTSGGMSSLFLPTEERVVNISSEHLEPVPPKVNDLVKIIHGDRREQTGKLLSVDGNEGVVALGGDTDNIELINLHYMCKMIS